MFEPLVYSTPTCS